MKAANVRHYAKNSKKLKVKKIEYRRIKLATDQVYRMVHNLRRRLHNFLKGRNKSVSTVRDMGCSPEYLKLHLEDAFYPNVVTGEVMDWNNYGAGHGRWNIDHRIPFASIRDDPTNREKLLEIVHYTNLQPLWFEDNMAKGDRLDWVPDVH